MRQLIIFIFIFYSMNCLSGDLTVLTYHDISVNTHDNPYTVSRSNFVAQMDYLAQNGYQPISLAYLDKVKAGDVVLPEKPVILTFDDGLKSYYEFVVPLLSIYKYPSVSSIVTGWLDGQNIPPEYRGRLMSWAQLQKISQSKFVEVISHSNNLHYGIQSNPQGNTEAASIARQYFPEKNDYESEALFHKRISLDLQKSAARINEKLNYFPKAIAWPYGYFNTVISEIASKQGFDYQLTLEEGPTNISLLPMINRIMVFNNTTINDFIAEVNYSKNKNKEWRFAEIHLDPFLNKNVMQQEDLLSNLLDGLESIGVNMVIISPFIADKSKAFFVNDEYELATDILNRTLHLIKAKLPVNQIYLKLLKLSGDLYLDDADAFYTQLARLNWFNGIVFTDKPSEKELKRIKTITSRYHQKMKFGLLGKYGDNSLYDHRLYDFIMYSIDEKSWNNKLENIQAMLNGKPNKTYFLLDRTQKDDSEFLTESMKTLRKAGVKHYGFNPFDYYMDNPVDTVLSKELTTSTRLSSGG